MNSRLFLILLLFISTLSYSQKTEPEIRELAKNGSESEILSQCSQLLQNNFLYLAEILADRLLEFQPNNSNYHYRKGYLVLIARTDYEKALPYLTKAIEKTTNSYDLFSTREKNAPTDAIFYLARCYHLNQEIDKAIEFYKKFIEKSGKSSVNIEKANLHLEQCSIAKTLIATPKNNRIINVSDSINTSYPEYAPVISLDGTAIYFTSRRDWEDHSTDQYRDPMLNDFPEDIYVSYNDDSQGWSSPNKLDFCEGERNEATITISSDERRIYLYQDNTGAGDIFYSDFKFSKFQDILPFKNENVNTENWETHCTFSMDGNVMYFVSDREGGYGGRDIYRLVKLPNGEWSLPQNLGPNINTPYDEDCPFIAADNNTLYFSSNGPKSMGGFDIFKSFKEEGNTWGYPFNLGYPINSVGDDVFYTTTITGAKGYFSSFRKNGNGEKDIYEIENDYLNNKNIASLKGHITTIGGDEVLPEGVKIILKCFNCDDSREHIIKPTIRNGNFVSLLEPCREYEIKLISNSTLDTLTSEPFITSCERKFEEVIKRYIYDKEKDFFVPDDGYKFEGYLTDKENNPIENSNIDIIDNKTGETLETVSTNDKGIFKSEFLKNHRNGDTALVTFKVSKLGFLTQTFQLDVPLGEEPIIRKTFKIEKSELNMDLTTAFNLEPIYFDLNKANIRPDAAITLDKIVQIMNNNPNITIELGSHTDCRSSYAYNKNLSARRAKSSAEYIRTRISNPKRIYGKGYGESQLKVDCPCEGAVKSDCSEDQHQLNRRTEFKVVSIDGTSDNIGKIDETELEIENTVDIETNTDSTFIPNTDPLQDSEKNNVEEGFYIVRKGDTLYRVFLNTKVSVEELKRLNNLTNNNIAVGQKLLLK
jgi:outer membrane protein OmpA-like peptidoglycan-associated protein/tetratricopeptide (TPR) repeat protein